MSTTIQYMVPGKEAAPAISHYNFHRVHGAQIAVFSRTRRKPVLTCRKPLESRSAIGKDRFSTRFGQSSTFASPYKTRFFSRGNPWKPVRKIWVFDSFWGSWHNVLQMRWSQLMKHFWRCEGKKKVDCILSKCHKCLIQDVHSILMVCWYIWHSLGNSWFPKVRLFWEMIVFS